MQEIYLLQFFLPGTAFQKEDTLFFQTTTENMFFSYFLIPLSYSFGLLLSMNPTHITEFYVEILMRNAQKTKMYFKLTKV